MTRDVLHEDPLSGHLFVFCNPRACRDGYVLWYNQLEKGRFHLPTPPPTPAAGSTGGRWR